MHLRLTHAAIMLVICVGCAPQVKTIPIVTVGNTGCKGHDLTVFDYDRELRNWTAVCDERIYACSAVGGGTACAPAPSRPDDAEVLRRAALLRTLPKERAEVFVTKDVTAYDAEGFERLVAMAGLVDDELLALISKADRSSLVFAVLPADHLAKARACETRELMRVMVTSELFLEPPPNRYGSRCLGDAMRGVQLNRSAAGQTLWLITAFDESAVQAQIAKNAATGTRNRRSTETSPEPSMTIQESAPAGPSPAPADGAAAVDAEVRTSLDARASDLLACVGEPRALFEAKVDARGGVSIALRARGPDDPAQGCVRAVMGPFSVSTGPATVLHLVKVPAAQAVEPNPKVP